MTDDQMARLMCRAHVSDLERLARSLGIDLSAKRRAGKRWPLMLAKRISRVIRKRRGAPAVTKAAAQASVVDVLAGEIQRRKVA